MHFGNVGIGSTSPGGKLDVGPTGSICLGGTCNVAWPSVATQSEWGTIGSNIYNINAGNVGVGSTAPAAALDVNGGVRVSTQATCGAGNAGTIRWTGSRFQGCNGTTWVSLGYSVGTVCGITSSTYTGNIGGSSAADTLCQAVSGCSATARMCNSADIEATGRITNGFTAMANGTQYWYGGIAGGTYFNSCNNWTNSSNAFGPAIAYNTSNYYVQNSFQGCNNSYSVICCN